jgi:hypothetical protein
MGSAIFDFAGAPYHLEQRLGRMQRLGSSAYPPATTDTAAIDAENELAFLRTVETLVAALAAEGAEQMRSSHAG